MAIDYAGIKVLIVEDSEIAKRMPVTMLKLLICNVDTAATGKEAIDMALKTRYDIIFMDLGLPDMDGFQVAEAINKNNNEKETPIVALTAHDTEKMKTEASKVGMKDYIVKPLTAELAIKMIDHYVK